MTSTGVFEDTVGSSRIFRVDRACSSTFSSGEVLLRGGNDVLYNHAVLDSVFRSLPMGIILINGWGVIRALSKGGETMFMYPGWEVIGENVRLLMPPSAARRHDYYLSRHRIRVAKRVAAVVGQAETHVMLDNMKVVDEEQGKLVAQEVTKTLVFGGQKREVLAMDKMGTLFAVEISVTALFLKNQLYYLGFIADVRDLSRFQDLTVRQELLLRSMMDSSSMIRQLSGELSFQERFDSATVLYTDIVHYTQTCVRLRHAHLVAEFLSEVFGIFDKILASNSDATKIKTIGDCYVAASGVPVACTDHAKTLVQVAQSMLKGVVAYNYQVQTNQSVESLLYRDSTSAAYPDDDEGSSPRQLSGNLSRVRPGKPSRVSLTGSFVSGQGGELGEDDEGNGEQWRKLVLPLQIRTGMHSGPVVGGIFSQLRGGYDIYGATANKAQKMETTCRVMCIHLSVETYELLPREMQLQCTQRRGVVVPNFGVLNTYELKPGAFSFC
eukprot:RCo021749